MSNSRRLLVLAAIVFMPTPSGLAHSQSCRTLVVTKAKVAYAHVPTIRAAVTTARPCDWILIAPGVYRESIVVRTPELHIRGLDRNRVVLDGGHEPGNGIDVRADDVSIENLTVRNFDRRSLNDDETGNEVRWRGVHGWHGNYLTVYDTGTLGGYGLYAASSVGGEWNHVYASGFNDSGLYIGACRDCEAAISHAVAERNAYGYAGTNSGGHLTVEDSLFRDNTIGLTANSSLSDPPPPQLGTCDAGTNRLELPTIDSTTVARCTIFRHDRIVGNDNATAPANSSSLRPAAGIGIALMGAYGDLVTEDTVTGNRNIGILALELPYRRRTKAGLVHFQLAGNRFADNTVRGSRFSIALEGGLFGARQSIDNCFSGNRYERSLPADLAPLGCAHLTTPNPSRRVSLRILRIVTALHAVLLSHHSRAQPAPPQQQTMAKPCEGAPANPLCR
jgi:hypothetical protein